MGDPTPALPNAALTESRHLLFRLHGGYGFRLGGDDAQNDGILGQFDIAYRSEPLIGPLSLESGSSLDLFGETQHLAAYLQLNLHITSRFNLGLRGFGGGVKDDRETVPASGEDTDDLGGIVQAWLMGEYQIKQNFTLGATVGLDWQFYGDGGDQGTQWGLLSLLSLSYRPK